MTWELLPLSMSQFCQCLTLQEQVFYLQFEDQPLSSIIYSVTVKSKDGFIPIFFTE